MIKMQGIRKEYRMGEDNVVKALDGVDIHIRPHEFVAIIGPSGSGKSTLMNIIGCLDVADSGTYLLDDQEIGDYSEDELATVRNKKIGFIFQQFNLLPKLTARENVELPLIYQGMSAHKRRKRSLEVLERVGLADRMDHKPTELSGGQQQRVAIARALAGNPSLLLADEPTGNLDSKTGAEVMNLFKELHAAGNTIVLITHDHKVAQCAERIIRIEDGKLYENQEVPADDAVPVV
jgi:putative ABC transport system ATP-binding protein